MSKHELEVKKVLSSFETDHENDPKVREYILQYCCDFLGGVWKDVKPEHLTIKKLTGGTVNIILLCSLEASHKPIASEPTSVVFRIECKPGTGLVTETVVFSILGQKGLAPKLLGIFNGGRIEEYIVSRPLHVSEAAMLPIAKEIARQFAKIHQLQIPVKKNASFMTFIDEWYEVLSKNPQTPEFFEIPEHYHQWSPKTINMAGIKTEIEFIRSKLPKLLNHIVFCHNDLNSGNVLLFKDDNRDPSEMEPNFRPKLMLIDFEFAASNPRGFDLANHLSEYVYNYTNTEKPYSNLNNFPSKEHVFEFALAYMEASKPDMGKDELESEAGTLAKEILAFLPVATFFWTGYMINHGLTMDADFDFQGFAIDRFGLYFWKKHLLEEF